MIVILNPFALAGLYLLSFLLGYLARPPHEKRRRSSLTGIGIVLILTLVVGVLSYGHLWQFIPEVG